MTQGMSGTAVSSPLHTAAMPRFRGDHVFKAESTHRPQATRVQRAQAGGRITQLKTISIQHNVCELLYTKRAFQFYLTEIKMVNEISWCFVCVYAWEERVGEQCSGFSDSVRGG